MNAPPLDQPAASPFYRMLDTLLRSGELVLFGRVDTLTEAETEPVLQLLSGYYAAEAVDYPHTAPPFEEAAAGWAARCLFHAAQLLMYRAHAANELSDLFPPYAAEPSAGAVLSADLSLRFLPAVVRQLERIDVADALIPLLQNVLTTWHYSGLLSEFDLGQVTLGAPFEHPCLKSLYVERIIAKKHLDLARRDELRPLVTSALGDHAALFWQHFNDPL